MVSLSIIIDMRKVRGWEHTDLFFGAQLPVVEKKNRLIKCLE